jgi:hypothetical protein
MRRDEHFKSLAGLLNSLAAATFAVGVAAPAIGSLFFDQAFPANAIAASAVASGVIIVVFHTIGQFVLQGVRT